MASFHILKSKSPIESYRFFHEEYFIVKCNTATSSSSFYKYASYSLQIEWNQTHLIRIHHSPLE